MPISKREESEPTMLRSPEAYYEERLKGKTADEIRKEISRLKRRYYRLKKRIEDPKQTAKSICPTPNTEMEITTMYMIKARQALMDAQEYLQAE